MKLLIKLILFNYILVISFLRSVNNQNTTTNAIQNSSVTEPEYSFGNPTKYFRRTTTLPTNTLRTTTLPPTTLCIITHPPTTLRTTTPRTTTLRTIRHTSRKFTTRIVTTPAFTQTTSGIQPGTFCNTIDNCGINQFCIYQRCECQPNFEFTYSTRKCDTYVNCRSTSNCNTYDPLRVCENNSCDNCINSYTVDPQSKICNRTVESQCTTSSDCGSNEFCVNYLCECQSGYKYNSLTDKCEQKSCYYMEDCNQFDKNSICVGNICQCTDGYVKDPKTKFCNITTEKPCNNYTDCGLNQFCSNSLCECKPNFIFDKSLKSCKFQSCVSETDCNKFDTKRKCSSYGDCDRCETYYGIDSNTKTCNTTVGFYCTSSTDCTQYGDDSQICIDQHCQCKPDFNLNTDWGYCTKRYCFTDSDCNSYDSNRVCSSGSCVCRINYIADKVTTKCINKTDYPLLNLWWVYILWIIPVSLIVIFIYIVMNNSKDNVRQTTTVRAESAQIVIQTDDCHNQSCSQSIINHKNN